MYSTNCYWPCFLYSTANLWPGLSAESSLVGDHDTLTKFSPVSHPVIVGTLGATASQTSINNSIYSLIMPGFHHSVAILPLPFRHCRSVVPCHCTVAVLPFRSYHCRCRWERKCWKRLSVYIGMKWPECWLVVHQRQNGKNRIRSCCYGTAVTAQWQVETATAQRIFFT